MKKSTIFIIAILLLCGMVLCAADKPNVSVLKGQGAAETVHIVYPADCNDLIKQYAEVFAERLSEITSSEVIVCDEFSSYLVSYPVPRIHIGKPYEEDIQAFIKELEEENGGLPPFVLESKEDWERFCGFRDAYSLYCEENPQGFDLYINASDEWVLYCAIEDFLNEVKASETYTLNSGYSYVTPDDHIFKSPYTAVDSGNAVFRAAETVAILPVEYMPYTDNTQGGGFDGEYAYYCCRVDAYAKIFQYNINTWELEAVSEPVHSRHSNDITYLPETNQLMICHCEDEENDSRGVTYVNADTFKDEIDTLLPVRASRFQYVEEREKYYILKAETVSVLDKDLNILSEQPSGDSRGTPQGCCTDEKYLYDIRWDVNDGERLYDHALIYNLDTMEYQFAAEITGVDETLEPENMIYDETVFYIAYHHIKYGNHELATVFRFVLLPEVLWAD